MRRITLLALSLIVFLGIAVVIFEVASIVLLPPVEYDRATSTADALGHVISLHEYRNATDQNWSTVMRFLEADPTWQKLYDYPDFVCADFARQLHDDAEKQGIRCGFVRINFTNYSFDPRWNSVLNDSLITSLSWQTRNADHAIDVFNTTDRGPVYVDITNDGITSSIKIGYLETGREYNTLQLSQVDLSRSDSFNYSYYEEIKNQYFNYTIDVDDYNVRVTDFNLQAAHYKSSGGGSWSLYLSLQDQENDLIRVKASLDASEESSWKMTCPRGYVSQIDVYW